MDCISLGTPGKQTISVLPRLKTNPVAVPLSLWIARAPSGIIACFRNSSPPPRTPPTRGGGYILSLCIPPPVPLTEGEKGGGGRVRGGGTVTRFLYSSCFFL